MKTNDLRYTTTKIGVMSYGEKVDIIVKIRLNDECKNGYQDFSITANIYKSGKRSDESYISGGCCHDEILKHFPEFKIFINLHLADANGVPMYAVDNGFYHLKNGFNNTPTKDEGFKAKFCSYYRLTIEQYDILKDSENKLEYAILLKDLGVLTQWKNEADEAVKMLEKLTGDKFVNDSKKSQYQDPESDKIADFRQKKKDGYFTPENKEKRANEAKKEKELKLIETIKNSAAKDINKIKVETKLKLWLISHIKKLNNKKLTVKKGFDIDVFFDDYIYYNHSNTLSFGTGYSWKTQTMSEKYFDLFCDGLSGSDFNKLPSNITFELKGVKKFCNH